MNKGLKALERNRNFIERYFVEQLEEKGVYHKDMKDAMFNDLSIIEKELKRLYGLEKTTVTFSDVQQIMFELEKNKKALEIIKKKKVNLRAFYFYDNLYEYNEYVKMANDLPFQTAHELTQEEYDLLKEVLL